VFSRIGEGPMGMLIMIAVSVIGAIIIAHMTQRLGHLLERMADITQRFGHLLEKLPLPAKMRFVQTPELLILAAVLSPIMLILLGSGVFYSPVTIAKVAKDFLIFGVTTLTSVLVADHLIARM